MPSTIQRLMFWPRIPIEALPEGEQPPSQLIFIHSPGGGDQMGLQNTGRALTIRTVDCSKTNLFLPIQMCQATKIILLWLSLALVYCGINIIELGSSLFVLAKFGQGQRISLRDGELWLMIIVLTVGMKPRIKIIYFKVLISFEFLFVLDIQNGNFT